MARVEKAARSRFKRVLLKLSGEALQDREGGQSLSPAILASITEQVRAARALGAQVAIVVGGGNIFRGLPGEGHGIDRVTGDYMGMLATMINALALQATLARNGIDARAISAIAMPAIADTFSRRTAVHHLDKGRVVVFGAGTGNPFFTTDTAAALRASEIGADLLLKATKVDGIYTEDPVKNPKARRFETLTYQEALQRQLKVMDAAAFSLCQENRIPIIVFNFFKKNELVRALKGEAVGTLVRAG